MLIIFAILAAFLYILCGSSHMAKVFAGKEHNPMADKDTYQAALAAAVHEAERAYGETLAAPASATRIEKINRACAALDQAQQRYDHCLSEQATMIPVKR